MRTIWRSIFRGLLAFGLLALLSCSTKSTCSLDKSLMSVVSESRGLEFVRKVPCKSFSEDEIFEELKRVMFERNDIDELKSEEILYRLLGIIPHDYDYINGLLNAYKGTVKGFYNAGRDYFVLNENVSVSESEEVLLHELTHTLQDQHFGIEKILPKGIASDSLLARMALLEGDAMRSSYIGLNDLNCKFHNLQATLFQAQHIIFLESDIPTGLRLLVAFPQLYGMFYLCEMEKELGPEFLSALFKNLPQRSSQVMHPKRFAQTLRENRKPEFSEISIEEFPNRHFYTAVVGEYTVFSMLAPYLDLDRSLRVARGLEADRVWIADEQMDADSKTRLFIWKSQWSSGGGARDFVNAFLEQRKSLVPEAVVSRRSNGASIVFPKGSIEIIQDGRNVEIEIRKRQD